MRTKADNIAKSETLSGLSTHWVSRFLYFLRVFCLRFCPHIPSTRPIYVPQLRTLSTYSIYILYLRTLSAYSVRASVPAARTASTVSAASTLLLLSVHRTHGQRSQDEQPHGYGYGSAICNQPLHHRLQPPFQTRLPSLASTKSGSLSVRMPASNLHFDNVCHFHLHI